ncbi:uncharacterized protein MELLADRAFT_86767 [Melampsora larici-populina 98AG31]|uniref:Uncharacterized protein n=1 Tax=Melampsora larici-populina (strain 98AG31 / pathotype 3-4-7) TaxID=747676 RepID=F4R3C3_MELLP|nr:uncharacterized protein MELLADRAFT_86767 [Melampsora larici-populina 98AG31]EGG13193.1 hypothetical protein MELLADRAFT_86767 [Melampsora larici-populina 98AG31]
MNTFAISPEQLFADGRFSEAKALQTYIASQQTGSTVGENGERVPAAGGSGLPNARPYNLVAEDLSSHTESSETVPLADQFRPPTYRPSPFLTDPEIPNTVHTAQAQTFTAVRMPTRMGATTTTPGPRGPTAPSEVCPYMTLQPSTQLAPHNAPPIVRFDNPGLVTTTVTGQQTREDIEEMEQVKVLMASKRGRMVLRNGDVVENGRLLVADTSEEMEKGLPQLSPVLRHWLKTFRSYIPLTAFNKYFLIDDQTEWSRRKAPSESKIEDGNASLRVYGRQPPPDELAMQFEEWIDCMGLFIKYVADVGWQTLAERFDGHRLVVMDLRESYGWMVALRYCIRIRQGVMRESVDNRIRNFSKLQSAIFEAARLQADTQQEQAYRTNPYATGGPLAHLNPQTGLPRITTSTATKRSAYDAAYQKPPAAPQVIG